jgi:hypothetical protein
MKVLPETKIAEEPVAEQGGQDEASYNRGHGQAGTKYKKNS